MTTIERKQNELANLLADHRIVKVEMQAEHAVCIARVDMPEYGIKAGQQFDLFASSYEGYAYIIKQSAEGRECSCIGFEYKHSCKHVKSASASAAARYYAHKAETGDLVLEPMAEQQLADERKAVPSVQFEDWGDCDDKRAGRIASVLLPECQICHKRYERADHGCAVPSAEKRAAFEQVREEVAAIEYMHRVEQLVEASLIAATVLGDLDIHVEDSIESGEFADPFAGMSEQERRQAYREMFPNDYSDYDCAA